jgi:hypothetical protein
LFRGLAVAFTKHPMDNSKMWTDKGREYLKKDKILDVSVKLSVGIIFLIVGMCMLECFKKA